MRIFFPVRRRLRALISLGVWVGSIAGAFWLYSGLGGSSEAVGIAETKAYRISPSQLGRVTSLDVAEGQFVAAGQVVARLETQLIEEEMSVARAEMEQAASEVDAVSVSLDTTLLQTERSFESEIESVRVELQSAKAEQARDQTALNKLLDELQREDELVKKGLTRNERLKTLELSRSGLETAVREWPARIGAIEARGESAATRLAELRKAHARAPGGSKLTQLKPMQDKVRERKQSIQLLRTKLRQTVLRAASAGYVSAIHARPGEVLTPGQAVLTLVEVKPRYVVAYLEERKGEVLTQGGKVTARRRTGAREQFEGTVAVVSGDIAPLPQRVWTNPHVPSWGRAVYISVPETASLQPGEMLDIMRTHSGDAVTQILAQLRRLKPAASSN